MKKFIPSCFFIVFILLLATCKTDSPTRKQSSGPKGVIIGTLGCYDKEYENVLHGYFIDIDQKDTFLTFHLDMQEPILVQWGTRAIYEIEIPYRFTYRVLEPNDDMYVDFELPAESGDYESLCVDLLTIKQIAIYPEQSYSFSN